MGATLTHTVQDSSKWLMTWLSTGGCVPQHSPGLRPASLGSGLVLFLQFRTQELTWLSCSRSDAFSDLTSDSYSSSCVHLRPLAGPSHSFTFLHPRSCAQHSSSHFHQPRVSRMGTALPDLDPIANSAGKQLFSLFQPLIFPGSKLCFIPSKYLIKQVLSSISSFQSLFCL